MSTPFATRNNHNNYLTAGRSFPKHKSLMHPAHNTNNVEYPKPKNSANSLRSHSSKNEHKEESVNKSSITKYFLSARNPIGIFAMRNNTQRSSTENNPCSYNIKKYSREVDHSSRSFTSKSSENNLRITNSKKRSTEVENSDSVEEGIIKKRSIETGSLKRISTTTQNPMQGNRNEVRNLSRGATINSFNRVENNSRLTNPRKRSIEAVNNSSPANPQKRSRVENQNNSSITHSLVRGGSAKNNIRAVTNRSVVINIGSNLAQRNGTGNDSRIANSQHSRKPVNSLLPVGFDRFSTQALSNKVKNKDLSKSEWENIRLIKVE
jgi:hypothetical protein